MTTKKNRPGQGRKENEIKNIAVTITLPPHLLEWLKQYGGVSKNISKILGAIYEQHNKK